VVPQKEMLGTFGVGIFFVLSGFLITGVLQHHLVRRLLICWQHLSSNLACVCPH
jgi:peptidoglycan/LPS O-acetylase OafA/YrhL